MSNRKITEITEKDSVFKKVIPLMTFCTLCIVQMVIGQTWEGSLQAINETAWGTYVKPAIQIGLFIWFAIKVIGLFIQRDKEHNWWAMLMLLGGVVICEFVDDIYLAITGTNAVGS